MREIASFIEHMPKAELHLHIEGSLEPDMMVGLAERNHVQLRFATPEAARAAYRFSNLQEFLDLYYQGMSALVTEADFRDLTWAYLLNAARQSVVHTEIFFDPQAHVARGVAFATVVGGISSALEEGRRKLGLSSHLILCFLRHLDESDAFATLEAARPFRALITGVGLDSSELGNPPTKFARVFAEARRQGYRLVAHAGEEGPPSYVREAIDILGVERIDHGVRAIEDVGLVELLRRRQIPLTVCPLSNLKLGVVDDMAKHPLPRLLAAGLLVTVNSDDPSYFGGYIAENYLSVAKHCGLDFAAVRRLARNAFTAAFLSADEKAGWHRRIDAVADELGG